MTRFSTRQYRKQAPTLAPESGRGATIPAEPPSNTSEEFSTPEYRDRIASPLAPVTYHLTCPGQPVSGKNHMQPIRRRDGSMGIKKGRAVSAWYGRVVPELLRQFQRAGGRTLAVPVHVEVHQYVAHDLESTANPDGDNAQSASWDALVQARVLRDDRLILSWSGSKQQDRANPRVDILIRVL